ncbi:MAG: universal stress protein [Solirubrobacterales bacterium]
MFRKILVGYLEGDHGADALALGRRLSLACKAPLEVATAPGPEGRSLGQIVRAHGADLLVLGSTHRVGLGRVVPGATAEQVLGEAPCAVAVAPDGFGRTDGGESRWRPLDGDDEDSGMRVIGVGFNGSTASRHALEVATELALRNGASLRVYTVVRKFANLMPSEQSAKTPVAGSEVEAMRTLLNEAVRELPPEVRALPVFLRGFEADELVRAANLGVDLLLLGSRPGGPLRRHLHKSVSSAVLTAARCPLLIVPTGVAAPLTSAEK